MDDIRPATSRGLSALSIFSLGIVALLAIVFIYLSKGSTGMTGGMQVEFLDAAIPVWYQVQGTSLVPSEGPQGYDTGVLEAGAAPVPGEHVVLAQVAGSAGITLSVLHADKTLTAVVADGKNKSSLAARPDGLVAFAENAEVYLANVQNKTAALKDLGAGRSPRVAADGSIIVLAPTGLVRVNPVTLVRDMVIERAGADGAGGAISPDGSTVALPDTDLAQIDFFAIRRTKPVVTSYLGSLTDVAPGTTAAFVDATRVVVRSATSSATLYSIPLGSGGSIASVSTFSIAP